MKLLIKGSLPLILVYSALCSINVRALPLDTNVQVLTPTAAEKSWRNILQKTVQQHPEVIAAKQSIDSEVAYTKSQSKPLYNPELNADMNRTGDATNVKIGIEQTLDWWGKADLYSKKAKTQENVKRYQAQQVEQQVIYKLLSVLLEWRNVYELLAISQQQAQQIERLRATLNREYQTGEISYLENQLAQLAHTQQLQETLAVANQYRQALAEISLWIPDFNPSSFSDIPREFWKDIQSPDEIKIEELLDSRIQQFSINGQRIEEEIITLQSKPEPTIGLYTGREEEEKVIGLSVSVPLNIRNNYQSVVEASKAKTQTLLTEYEAAKHQQTLLLKKQWSLLKNHERQYQSLDKSTSINNANYLQSLLDKQLSLNDISVSEYLRNSQLFLDVKTSRTYAKQQWLKTQLEYLLLSDQLLPVFRSFVGGITGVSYE